MTVECGKLAIFGPLRYDISETVNDIRSVTSSK